MIYRPENIITRLPQLVCFAVVRSWGVGIREKNASREIRSSAKNKKLFFQLPSSGNWVLQKIARSVCLSVCWCVCTCCIFFLHPGWKCAKLLRLAAARYSYHPLSSRPFQMQISFWSFSKSTASITSARHDFSPFFILSSQSFHLYRNSQPIRH